MTARGHVTAGDLSPLMYGNENSYGTEAATNACYGAIAAEGGSFKPTDNPHPHMTWRAGSRTFSRSNYVTQQDEAGFQATFEVPDDNGLLATIIGYAHASLYTNSLPSRTVAIRDRAPANTLKYIGCKTEELTISADAPGGVVKFEETVLASYSEYGTLNSISNGIYPAIQWTGGIILGDNSYYPQSFKLRIRNNLGRVYGYSNGQSITKALLEGREEIDFEMDLWMEDLAWLANNMYNGLAVGSITINLGIKYPKILTLTGLTYACDGDNTALVQDKQLETVRMRAKGLTLTDPSP